MRTEQVQKRAIVLAATLTAVLSSCANGATAAPTATAAPAPTPIALSGSVDVVIDTSDAWSALDAGEAGTACTEGTGLSAGEPAVLESADGTVIGLGELEGGEMTGEGLNYACRLPFAVDVPDSEHLAGEFFTLKFRLIRATLVHADWERSD